MRNKFSMIAAAALIVAVLSACSPVAQAIGSAAASVTAQSLPAAPAAQAAGGPVVQNAQQPTGAAQQPTTSAVRTVTVTGTGRATLTPDMAYVNIGVHTENTSISEAMAANRTQTQQVTDAIKGQGVDPKDIQTTNFNVYPMQKNGPNGENIGVSYVVDNSVYVTVRDLSKLGTLLDAAVQSGANNINGIQFDVSDKTAALSSARKDAVKNAEELAKELTDASGTQLGQVLSISTNTTSLPTPVYGYGMGGGAASPSAAVPISQGQMVLSVDVAMVFEIH